VDTGDADEPRVYETGRESVEREEGAAGSATATIERTFAQLSVHNATLTATFEQDPETVVTAREPTWRMNGSLTFDAADGQVASEYDNASLDGDTVTLVGDTTLSLETLGERDDPGSANPDWYTGENAPPAMRGEMGSKAESMRVNGQSLDVPETGGVPEEVTFWGQVLGLLLIAWSLVKKVPAFLAALLAKDPLTNDRRQRIYAFIQERGLAYPRMIERELDIPFSSVNYHLRILSESGLLTCVEAEGYTVYFPCTELTPDQKERLAVLASPKRRRIAEMVARQGSGTQQALLDALGLAQSTVAEHLRKLEEAGLVESNGNHGIRYRPSELLRGWLGLDSEGSASGGEGGRASAGE